MKPKKGVGLLIMAPKPDDDKHESDEGDGRVSEAKKVAAEAVMRAVHKRDEDLLAESLSQFVRACRYADKKDEY